MCLRWAGSISLARPVSVIITNGLLFVNGARGSPAPRQGCHARRRVVHRPGETHYGVSTTSLLRGSLRHESRLASHLHLLSHDDDFYALWTRSCAGTVSRIVIYPHCTCACTAVLSLHVRYASSRSDGAFVRLWRRPWRVGHGKTHHAGWGVGAGHAHAGWGIGAGHAHVQRPLHLDVCILLHARWQIGHRRTVWMNSH